MLVILKILPCGEVGQLGAVNVYPLSVPASIGSAYEMGVRDGRYFEVE